MVCSCNVAGLHLYECGISEYECGLSEYAQGGNVLDTEKWMPEVLMSEECTEAVIASKEIGSVMSSSSFKHATAVTAVTVAQLTEMIPQGKTEQKRIFQRFIDGCAPRPPCCRDHSQG